jgi:hypothetical protein
MTHTASAHGQRCEDAAKVIAELSDRSLTLDNASAVNTMDAPPKSLLALRAGFAELKIERLL